MGVSFSSMNTGIVLHAAGIYLFFLSWGVYQEKITTTAYNGSKFVHFLFLIFLQSLGGTVISFLTLKFSKKPLSCDKNLLLRYFQCSIFALISNQTGYKSLKFINYPTLIIGKSCKLIPIAVMNFILYKKTFHWKKYASILLTTVGVFSFMFFGKQSENTKSNSFLGVLLLLSNLILDGTINSIQENIFRKYDIDSFHMMFYSNMCTLITTSLILLSPLTSQLLDSLFFIKKNPQILVDLACFSGFNVFGQIIVYSMIQKYGSMSLVTVTVTRKLFSILISLLFFSHSLNTLQVISVVTVFLSLMIELVDKKRVSIKKD